MAAFYESQTKKFLTSLEVTFVMKPVYNVIMQIVTNPPLTSPLLPPPPRPPMRNQNRPWFGLHQWVEQVATILLTVTHHFCNERAFQEWTLRTKYVGVYNMTQETKHSECLFSPYRIFLNPGCGHSLNSTRVQIISDMPAQQTPFECMKYFQGQHYFECWLAGYNVCFKLG